MDNNSEDWEKYAYNQIVILLEDVVIKDVSYPKGSILFVVDIGLSLASDLEALGIATVDLIE